MMIACPECQAQLNLPAGAEGKLVRCPACKHVFRADSALLKGAIQAGSPEAAPTGVTSERPESSELPDERPRRYEEDDYDEPGFCKSLRQERDELEEAARPQTRGAGWTMLAAFCFTLANVLVNGTLSALTQFEVAGANNMQPGPPVMLGVVCGIVIFGSILLFVFLAGRCLLNLGARGLIITGVVMNFILLLFLGGGAVLNIVVLTAAPVVPVPIHLVWPTIVMNSISCLLNLVAAVLAIRALMAPEVSSYYAFQYEQAGRSRY